MDEEKRTREKRILFLCSLGSFLIPFVGSSINIALPSIGSEFGLDAITLSWIATSYLLSAAVFLVPFGRLADITSRKTVFVSGIAIYTVASLLSAISFSTTMLIVSRILQGMGGSMIFATSTAILAGAVSPQERGKAMGINVAAVYTGLSTGPFIGGFLTERFGWRSIFLLNIFLGLILQWLAYKTLRQEKQSKEESRFDLVGSVVYAISISLTMYGMSNSLSTHGISFIISGLICFLLFIKWETKTENPVFRVDLFVKNRVFAFSNVAALINYSSTFAVTFLISLYLQYVRGFSPRDAGLILASQPVIMAVFSPFAGKISDKIEPRIVASIGMAITTVALIFFAFLTEQSGVVITVANLALLGLGIAAFSSPNTNAVMSSVESRFYGIASATLGTMRLAGQMLSMAMATFMLNHYLGKIKISPSTYPIFMQCMNKTFILFCVLCIIGIFASLARSNVHS